MLENAEARGAPLQRATQRRPDPLTPMTRAAAIVYRAKFARIDQAVQEILHSPAGRRARGALGEALASYVVLSQQLDSMDWNDPAAWKLRGALRKTAAEIFETSEIPEQTRDYVRSESRIGSRVSRRAACSQPRTAMRPREHRAARTAQRSAARASSGDDSPAEPPAASTWVDEFTARRLDQVARKIAGQARGKAFSFEVFQAYAASIAPGYDGPRLRAVFARLPKRLQDQAWDKRAAEIRRAADRDRGVDS